MEARIAFESGPADLVLTTYDGHDDDLVNFHQADYGRQRTTTTDDRSIRGILGNSTVNINICVSNLSETQPHTATSITLRPQARGAIESRTRRGILKPF